MVVQEKHYTVEEFWEISQQPEYEGRRLELDEGVIVEMPPSSPKNTMIAARIIYFLSAFVLPHNLGYVTAPDGGYRLSPGKVRQPDAAFISRGRLPQVPDVLGLAPDLAVEVASPNEDVLRKVNEYLRAGTRIVWVIYADEKTVYVFSLNDDGSLHGVAFDINGTLDGGDVLPGFTLSVRDIFPE